MPYVDLNLLPAAEDPPVRVAPISASMATASLPVVEVEVARDGGLVLVGANPAAESALGIVVPGCVGRALDEVCSALASSPAAEHLLRVAETGTPAAVDLVLPPGGPRQATAVYQVSIFAVAPRRSAALFTDITDRVGAERALRQLMAVSSGAPGPGLLNDLARCLAQALGADAVIVGELLPDPPQRVAAVAMAIDGAVVDGISCEVADSPFRDVLAHGSDVVCSGLCDRYPNDVLIQVTQCQAGVGCCLHGSEGDVIGVVAALFRSAIGDAATVQSVLAITAARVAGELERARAEEALGASERKFRALIEQASDVTAVLDCGGRIIFESCAASRLLGYTAGALLGRNALELIHPEDAENAQASLIDLAQRGGSGDPTEARVRRADGSWVYLEIVGENLISDPTVRGFLLSARDVTARHRAEETQRLSDRRIRSFFDAPMVGAAIWLPDGPCAEANDRFCEMLGYSRDELIGMTWTEVTHPDDVEAETRSMRSVESGAAESCMREKRYVRRDGSVLRARVYTGCVRRPDGTVDHYASVVEDLGAHGWLAQGPRASEERRRDLAEMADSCLWEVDEHGVLTFCSHRMCKILGYAPEDVIGHRPADFLASEELERRGEQLAQLLELGGAFRGFRCIARHKDGSTVTVQIGAAPFTGADGRIAGYRGTLQRAP